MTIRELSQLYYLDKLIQRDEERLEQMRARLTNISPKLSGMPGQPGVSDKVGESVAEIVDLARQIEEERVRFEIEKARLENYLRCIEDTQTRLIFILRFVDLKSWEEVAAAVGGNNTEGSVKQACYRYLKEQAKSKVVPNVPPNCDKV
jgi:hypothetical protein